VGISLSFLNQLTPYSIILKRTKIILYQPPPSKSLVSTLSHENEGQNNNYSHGLKAKTETKPAPKSKTTRKLYQAMELAHTLSNE